MAPPRALRVKHVLARLGIGPSELTRALGLSKSTWSRFLDGRRDIKGMDARGALLELLSGRGLPATPDLFSPTTEDDGPRPSEVAMQGQRLSSKARELFQLFMDPFAPEAILKRTPGGGAPTVNELYLPPSHMFIGERIRQCALSAGFIAVSGEPGSGKSTLLDHALERAAETAAVVRVMPANVERRKLTAAHISAEIIRQLSEERIPRIANRRDAVAMEVLVQRYEEGGRVVLVIDEAHELPHNTIKDLKRFHEMRHGYAQLLGVILVGQTELRARFDSERNFRLREAIIRCQMISLGPMAGHVAEYVARRFEWVGADAGKVFEDGALRALEQRLGVHEQQFPVLIGNAAIAAMNVAARRGAARVTDEEIDAVWAASPEQLQELGL